MYGVLDAIVSVTQFELNPRVIDTFFTVYSHFDSVIQWFSLKLLFVYVLMLSVYTVQLYRKWFFSTIDVVFVVVRRKLSTHRTRMHTHIKWTRQRQRRKERVSWIERAGSEFWIEMGMRIEYAYSMWNVLHLLWQIAKNWIDPTDTETPTKKVHTIQRKKKKLHSTFTPLNPLPEYAKHTFTGIIA